jgi:hypothetical protein
MNWKTGIGYGVAIWILMFVIVSVFIGFKAYDNSAAKVVTVIIAGVLSYLFARKAKPANAGKALSYGVVWAVAGLILDAIVTIRFNPAIFAAKSLWLGYLLVLLAPLLVVKKPQGA